MNVFQLMLFTCVKVLDLGGDVSTVTCQWSPRSMHTTEQLCSDQGAEQLGQPLRGFYGARTIEKIRCDPLWVFTK